MKKTIIILIGATVAISLLWLVDETLLTKTSGQKSAENQQEVTVVGKQGPSTEQKTEAKPKWKPPVYDLSNKAHWYDPERTIGIYESKTLAEWLEPFKPNSEEFQIIAQYETSFRNLKESLSEDEYYSVEGRKWLIDEILKLNKQLWEQLGEERTQFYAEVRKLETGYYHTWEVLTANGISEDRVSEFRELADEFNQQMQDFSTGIREKRRIAKSFRDRIENEFGKQVLDDIYFLNPHTFSMFQLDMGDPRAALIRAQYQYPEQKERLKKLYDFEFGVGTGAFEKFREESDRRERLEMNLWKEWVKHYDKQPADPEEFLFY